MDKNIDNINNQSNEVIKIKNNKFNLNLFVYGVFIIGFILIIQTIHLGWKLKNMENQILGEVKESIANLSDAKNLSVDDLKKVKNKAQTIENTFLAIKPQKPLFFTANAMVDNGYLAVNSLNLSLEILIELFSFYQNHKVYFDNILQLDGGTPKISLTEKIENEFEKFEGISNNLELIISNLKHIDQSALPEKYQILYEHYYDDLIMTLKHAHTAFDNKEIILEMLGNKVPHLFFIALQNDNEIRPSGGFIGSYVLLEFNDGYITHKSFHDIYELDGQFNQFVDAPFDISLITDQWKLRDSNYSPDFSLSASKMAWFLEQEGGPSVDSVVTVNLSLLEDLLGKMGPFENNVLNAALTEDNLSYVLSFFIETKLFGESNPKEILNLLMPEFEKYMIANIRPDLIIKIISNAITTKNVQAFSFNPQVQDLYNKLNVTNQIYPKKFSDFLGVIHSSIGGNKSDEFISQKINKDTIIKASGRIVNKVTVTRRHNFSLIDIENIQVILKLFGVESIPDMYFFIIGNSENISHMKIFTPLGSKLLSVEGTKLENVSTYIDENIQKTIFLNKMYVKPGETYSISYTYELPYKVKENSLKAYEFEYFKQSGMKNESLETNLIIDPSMSIENTVSTNDIVTLKGNSFQTIGKVKKNVKNTVFID